MSVGNPRTFLDRVFIANNMDPRLSSALQQKSRDENLEKVGIIGVKK